MDLLESWVVLFWFGFWFGLVFPLKTSLNLKKKIALKVKLVKSEFSNSKLWIELSIPCF